MPPVTLSIIVPLADNETAWQLLLSQLTRLLLTKTSTAYRVLDIVLVTSLSANDLFARLQADTATQSLPEGGQLTIKQAPAGRASQMNAGAAVANGDFLWFLHADTVLSDNSFDALADSISQHPTRLHYFDLAFLKDATALMRLNQMGVKLRSRLAHTPFGDQGFCLGADLFEQLGGYPEQAAYGEDHLLVWRARQQGICLQPVGSWLWTSARKYQHQGWLRTTIRHQILWLRQAWPEWRQLRRLRRLRQQQRQHKTQNPLGDRK